MTHAQKTASAIKQIITFEKRMKAMLLSFKKPLPKYMQIQLIDTMIDDKQSLIDSLDRQTLLDVHAVVVEKMKMKDEFYLSFIAKQYLN